MAIRDDFEVAAGQVRAAVQRFALGLLVHRRVRRHAGRQGRHRPGRACPRAGARSGQPRARGDRPAGRRRQPHHRRPQGIRHPARGERPPARGECAAAGLADRGAPAGERERAACAASPISAKGPEASFITARIVGDSVSAYVRGALLNVGRKAGVASGQAVVTGEGLAGRIAEVGDNSARVLFVTDVNSRLPVLIERTRERAILAGDNSAQLRLTLLQSRQRRAARRSHHHLGPRRQLPGRHPGRRGRRDRRGPACACGPFADFSRLEFVRVVDYGVTGLVSGGHSTAGDAVGRGRPEGAMMRPPMKADGLLAMLDRWGRAALPGAVLLFFVAADPGAAARALPLRRPAAPAGAGRLPVQPGDARAPAGPAAAGHGRAARPAAGRAGRAGRA